MVDTVGDVSLLLTFTRLCLSPSQSEERQNIDARRDTRKYCIENETPVLHIYIYYVFCMYIMLS